MEVLLTKTYNEADNLITAVNLKSFSLIKIKNIMIIHRSDRFDMMIISMIDEIIYSLANVNVIFNIQQGYDFHLGQRQINNNLDE